MNQYYIKAGVQLQINVIEYLTVGTWSYSKPSNLSHIEVICIGGGGGGASGARRPAPAASNGGAAGGCGSLVRSVFSNEEISSYVTIIVPGGGSGGPSNTTNNTGQKNGSIGGSASFGTYMWAYGGSAGSTTGGAIQVRTLNKPFTNNKLVSGGGGSNGGTTGAGTTGTVMTTNSSLLIYGGGGGGGISAASPGVPANGGAGSRVYNESNTLSSAITGGIGIGVNNKHGKSGSNNYVKQIQMTSNTILHTIGLGYGGSGGGAGLTMSAGNGATGSLYGGGGSGGGASRDGFDSGKGGDGAQGAVVIYEWLIV